MNGTDHFKRTIQAYLDSRAAEDKLFAASYSKPNKNCLLYTSNILKLFKAELRQQALMHTRHQVKRTIEAVVDRRFQNINALEDHLDHLGQEIRPRAIYEGLCRDFNRYVQELSLIHI